MLSSIKVDEVEPVLYGDGVLLHLLVNDLPPLDQVSSSPKGWILLTGVDTSKKQKLDVAIRSALAKEGCKGVDDGLINTIEESWSVELDRSIAPAAFKNDCRLPEDPRHSVSTVYKLIEEQFLGKS